MQSADDDIDALAAAWRLMTLIRAFEEALDRARIAQQVAGVLHLACGQEAIAAAVHHHLRDEDWVASTHRCHGHGLAAGCDLTAIAREIFGRQGGLSDGRGGSQHLVALDTGFLGGNGIVGAGAGLAAGAALSARHLGTGGVGLAFIGDGACQQGVVHEVANIAALMALPLIIVIENNGWAQGTPLARSAANPNLAGRFAAAGLAAEAVDGTDFFALDGAIGRAFARARADALPGVIEARLSRRKGHYAGDPQTYRVDDDSDAGTADCLDVFRDAVAGRLATDVLDRIAETSRNAAEDAVATARRSPWPAAAETKR